MSEKKYSLSGLLGFLSGKGYKVKLNEGAANEDEQFELIEEAVDDPVTEEAEEEVIASPFSEEEVKGIKNLLTAFAGAEPEAFANALKGMPLVTSFIQNAQESQKAEKELVIARIKANSANIYSDEELALLPITILNKMDASMDINYMAMGGAQEVFENSADDGVLQPKSSFMAMAEQESE